MTYRPKLEQCPLCGTMRSPLATLCHVCYLKAKKDGCKNTGDIQKWVAAAKEKKQMTDTKHELYAMEQDFLKDGEVAECTCGWQSKRGTFRQARAWLADHIAERSTSPEPEKAGRE